MASLLHRFGYLTVACVQFQWSFYFSLCRFRLVWMRQQTATKWCSCQYQRWSRKNTIWLLLELPSVLIWTIFIKTSNHISLLPRFLSLNFGSCLRLQIIHISHNYWEKQSWKMKLVNTSECLVLWLMTFISTMTFCLKFAPFFKKKKWIFHKLYSFSFEMSSICCSCDDDTQRLYPIQRVSSFWSF